MYKAIIIDDEIKLREVLKIKIIDFCTDITVVGEASDVVEAEQVINEFDPDIIFLDIAMPGGTGFELLDKINPISFEIIFVTGFNEYAIDALKVSAVDYLLKPVKTDDLVTACEKAKARISKSELLKNYDVLKYNINNVGNQKTKVAVPNNDAYEFILISDIIRCEGWNKYTKVILKTGKELISSYNIGVFKELLKNYEFYPSHKSHLINKNYISRYLKEGTIVMDDNSLVPLARRRREEFLQEVLSKIMLR